MPSQPSAAGLTSHTMWTIFAQQETLHLQQKVARLEQDLADAKKGIPELRNVCPSKIICAVRRQLEKCNSFLLQCVPVHVIVINNDDMGFTFLGERIAECPDVLEPGWTDSKSCNSVVYLLAFALWRGGNMQGHGTSEADNAFRMSRDAPRLFMIAKRAVHAVGMAVYALYVDRMRQTQDEIIAGVLLMDRDLQLSIAWNTMRHFLEMEAYE